MFRPAAVCVLIICLIFLFSSCDDSTCLLCAGTGRCGECNGKGYISVDSNVCPLCRGSGRCFNCGGTGKIGRFTANGKTTGNPAREALDYKQARL